MKKYMTVAALLVAGTALANAAAESVLLFSDFASNQTLASLYKAGGLTSNLSGINSASGSYATVTSEDISALVTTTWNGVTLDTGWYLGTGSGVNISGWNTSEAGLTSSDGTASFKTTARPGYKSNYIVFVYDLSDLTLSGTYTESDTLDLALSYTTEADSVAQITLWYVDGTNAVTSVATGSAAGDGTTISGSIGYATEGKIIALFSNSSTSAATNYSKVSLVASIPEPSAFGLLAGVGALALVASRRRRTK